MSLSEIQEQEEKNRLAHEHKMKELEAKQRQLQSVVTTGWSADRYGNLSSRQSVDFRNTLMFVRLFWLSNINKRCLSSTASEVMNSSANRVHVCITPGYWFRV